MTIVIIWRFSSPISTIFSSRSIRSTFAIWMAVSCLLPNYSIRLPVWMIPMPSYPRDGIPMPFNIPMHIRCSTMSWHVIRPSRFIRFWIRARRTWITLVAILFPERIWVRTWHCWLIVFWRKDSKIVRLFSSLLHFPITISTIRRS